MNAFRCDGQRGREGGSFNEPGKVMGRSVYLHQQGIGERNGLLVKCTIGNKCVMSTSNLPGAEVCVCANSVKCS